MQIMKKGFITVLLIITLLGAPMLARVITNLFDFTTLDPDNAFLWISVRHILQALIILVVILLIRVFVKIDFGLGLGNRKVGISYLKKFILFFTGYLLVAFIITILSNQFSPFQFPLNSRNIFGYLGFQLFLSGPSEEFIFRAFAITIFTYFVTSKRIDKRMSYANLLAMLVFGIAHISIQFSPFSLSYSISQVLLAIGLGYFYGDCYEKSGSFIYPAIMHSISNMMMVSVTIVLTIFL